MIVREKIIIEKLEDYQKILQYLLPQYVDDDLITQLASHIGIQCKKTVVEFPYYENDYLSSYYIFYAKKLQSFPKECYRILFYEDMEECKLMGYITLRPTYKGRRLGKIFFNPKYLITEKARMVLGECKCHVGGSEAVLEIFPHMKQEGDVAVCAHVATWAVLRSFSNRFHRYPELTLGRIVEMISPEAERMIPSRGLTAFQISQVFRDSGFAPVILFNDTRNPRLIREALISYVTSGIPVVAVLTNRNHAISVVGLGSHPSWNGADLRERIDTVTPFESYWDGENEVKTNIVLSSRFYNTVIVNDDNFFPYSPIHIKRLEQKQSDKDIIPYTIPEIDRLIIPLYSRIQLAYEDVRTIVLRFISSDLEHWESGTPFICRIFLTSANTYREYINEECQQLVPDIRKLLINLEMPKFIWCAEISTPESYQKSESEVNSLIIIDSTSATINPEPFLFLVFPNGEIHFREANDIRKYICHDFCIPKMPRFNRILKEVKTSD